MSQQQLINRITELAIDLCTRRIEIVHVRYDGAANQLQITIGASFNRPPRRQMSIDLAEPSDSELTRARVLKNLSEAAAMLENLKRYHSNQPEGVA